MLVIFFYFNEYIKTMKIKYVEKPKIIKIENQTFEQLSKKFGVSVQSLKSYNKINFLYDGMFIAIPNNVEFQSFESKKVYVVKPADTIEKIADKLGVSQEYLKKQNQVSRVFIGQKLFY